MWFKRKKQKAAPEPWEQKIEFIIVEDDDERAKPEPGTVRGSYFKPSQEQVNIGGPR